MPDILIITNKSDFTADFVIKRMHELNINFCRFNTEDFPNLIMSTVEFKSDDVQINIETQKKYIDFKNLKGIWFRRPVRPKLLNLNKDNKEFAERECMEFLSNLWQISENINWVSHPDYLRTAEKKMLQLKMAINLNFKIPDTLISNDPNKIRLFIEDHNEDVISKPLSSGDYCGGKYAIYTNRITQKELIKYKDGIKLAPIIIQNRIDKIADIRTIVIGSKVFSFKLIPKVNKNIIDWRILKPDEIQYEYIKTPISINNKLLDFLNRFSIKFGAFDFAVTKSDEWVFLENNPNGQWAWLEQITNVKMTDSLINLLLKRK